MLKIVTIKKLTYEDIFEMLLTRATRNRRFLQSMIAMASRMDVEQGSLKSSFDYLISETYITNQEKESRQILIDLSIDPWDRLKEDLDFWIGTQLDLEDQTYSMLPWLEKIKESVTAEEAFRHLSDMNDAIGGVVPSCLDIGSERWLDVQIERIEVDGLG